MDFVGEKIYKCGDELTKIYKCDEVVWQKEPVYSAMMLTLEALTDGTEIEWMVSTGITAQENGKTIYYSKDRGVTWTEITSVEEGRGTPRINANKGDKILVKGYNTTYSDGRTHSQFKSNYPFKVYGNPSSLLGDDLTITDLPENYTFEGLFYDSKAEEAHIALPATGLTFACYRSMFENCDELKVCPVALPATTLKESCYEKMFKGTSITEAPELPATTLERSCYNSMFDSCTSLTTAPELPATTLGSYCYSSMFNGCTSLTTAPELPATTLAERCYYFMFGYCTSLTTAPVLPATTLAAFCYNSMFYGCTSLTEAPALPATTLGSYCYSSMFNGCTSLVEAPELPATILANNCYALMFSNCTSLTTAPSLPATTLTQACYSSMFNGCTSLNYIKCLATDISANRCTNNWVYGVSATGTFVKAAGMESWTTGVNGIPDGWTIEEE